MLVVLAELMEHDGLHHLLTSWLMGAMLCWGFTLGGLALLMVQYCSGGKWGLLIRRPLEAMSRTLWLVGAHVSAHPDLHEEALPLGALQQSRRSRPGSEQRPDRQGAGARHCNCKHPMLNPASVWVQIVICFAIWFFYSF